MVTDNTARTNLTTEAYCWYNNISTTYKKTYGALYNWYAVETGKLAPMGWHVPTDAEWDTFQNYLIANGYNYDGSLDSNKIVKTVASSKSWSLPSSKIYGSLKSGAICNNANTNNKSGFSAISGKYCEWNGYF